MTRCAWNSLPIVATCTYSLLDIAGLMHAPKTIDQSRSYLSHLHKFIDSSWLGSLTDFREILKSKGVFDRFWGGLYFKKVFLQLLLFHFFQLCKQVVLRRDNENDRIWCCLSSMSCASLVPTPCAPLDEKWSGEQSRISWAYSPKRWKTNEIVRSLIIT